jgi:hypothetical protein
LRNGSAISGATAKTYKLTSADYLKTITVKVTMKRTNFVVPTQLLTIPTAVDYTIRGDDKATISGTAAVGQTLHATPPQFFEADGTTNLVPTPTYTYRWYTGSTLLAVTSSPDFILTSAHKGKTIRVKVTAAADGRLARTTPTYSDPTAAVVTGTIVPGAFHPVIGYTATGTAPNELITPKVTFTGTPTIPAAGGFSYTYKWLRDGTPISGQTASSYKLVAADTGKLVTVVVTLSKTGYAALPLTPVAVNKIMAAELPTAQVNGANAPTAVDGDLLSVVVPLYYLQKEYPSGASLVSPAVTYQWFCDGVAIPSATASTYSVTAGDSGCTIYVQVTVNATYHASVTDTSNTIDIT